MNNVELYGLRRNRKYIVLYFNKTRFHILPNYHEIKHHADVPFTYQDFENDFFLNILIFEIKLACLQTGMDIPPVHHQTMTIKFPLNNDLTSQIA